MLPPWLWHVNLQSARRSKGHFRKPLLEKDSVGRDHQLPRWTIHIFSNWGLTSWLRSFAVIKHCVSNFLGYGVVVSGIWFSTSQTFIGWSSKGANFGGSDRCFHNGKKCEFFLPLYHWCLLEYFPKKFLILFNFHLSSNFLLCQVLPEETHMQEQEFDGLLIENNPAVADIQTIDSLVQHTTDGKKIICSAYFSTINMN